MTLPPHKIGDKGQRFLAQAESWPADAHWNNIGYSDTLKGAWDICDAIEVHPMVTNTRVMDRELKKVVNRKGEP